MNRLFRPTEKKHNEISKKNSRIRGQSPRHTVGQCLKLEKTHSGIFCVDLRDNNRSVGFAHENPPLSRSAGEGWGEGGSCPLCRISASHPHPNLPRPDGGRDKVAVTERGRLTFFQTTFHLYYFKRYLNQLLLFQLILQIRIINRRNNDAADAENPFEHDHCHQEFPCA